jgi:hypothetical protein
VVSSTATKEVCFDEMEYVLPRRTTLALTVRARRFVSSGFESVVRRACCPSSKS